MKNAAMNEMLKHIAMMSQVDKRDLIEQIMNMMQETEPAQESCNDLVQKKMSDRPCCPHCGAEPDGNVIRRGYNRNGAQRFYCKCCGQFFVPATRTVFARTRKDADTWRAFIEMTINGASLAECSDYCDIAYQTAFTWRHKVLNVFNAAQRNTTMTGMVEADEMLIPLSYKGNHIQGGFGQRKLVPNAVNDMPRDSYKRGTDNISRSSKDKACVFCMVENGSKSFFAGVPGVGFMTEPMLEATVAKHVIRDTALMLVDQYKITQNYLEKNKYDRLILSSNTSDNPHEHKPEIQGGNREKHMQHVNSMHHHIRNFLKPYYGVSSKYLANYISLFVWLKNNNCLRRRKAAIEITELRAAQEDCYITGQQIRELPLVPMCA